MEGYKTGARGALGNSWDRPVLVCVLGTFRVLKAGKEIPLRIGGKTEALLAALALGENHRVSRRSLLGSLWPDGDEAKSAHALTSMVHALGETLKDVLAGAPPVLYVAGAYCINTRAGIGVDIADFDALASDAELQKRAGNIEASVDSSLAAIDLYRGDVCAVDDIHAVVERERLRARYLSLLVHLADDSFRRLDYPRALEFARRLIANDPCREDAHRLVMRAHVRLGERAQALRHFRTCEQILDAEFGAAPERVTVELFDRIRLDPDGI